MSPLLHKIDESCRELTIHDITHVHQLWSVASEVCGPEYLLNPLEGFVLGAAFLIHDAGLTAAAYPGGLLAGQAQQPAMPVVGFLRPSRADEAGHLFAAVRQGLRESGYPSDKITIEARWADDQAERLPSLASELVNLQVSAIVGSVRAARRIHPLPGRGGQWRVDGADQMNDTGATLQQKQREVGKLLAGLCLVDRREQQVITAKANKQ